MHPDFKIFYRRPTADAYEFVATEIVQSDAEAIIVRFMDLLLRDGEEIDLYHQDGEEFLRQRWQVTKQHASIQAVYAWLQPISAPEPGNMRESDRVSTVFEGIHVRFGAEDDCPAIDVGDEGLAIHARTTTPLGSTHRLTLTFNKMTLSGHVTVCGIKDADPGQFRYGLRCEPDDEDSDLQRMLPMLTTALQVKRLETVSWSEDPTELAT